jgi:hypothetical protein
MCYISPLSAFVKFTMKCDLYGEIQGRAMRDGGNFRQQYRHCALRHRIDEVTDRINHTFPYYFSGEISCLTYFNFVLTSFNN